jgi:hypothetical protein
MLFIVKLYSIIGNAHRRLASAQVLIKYFLENRGKRLMFRLTKRLLPYVQRKDESILRALLPPKEELVLFVR